MKTLIYYLFLFFIFIVSLPILVLVSLIIFLSSGKPILFKQKRVGEKGKIFTLFKFRTMIKNAEKLQEKYKKLNEAKGPVFKIHNDPRFTKLGRFLSHTGLDEIPQLFNVINGDMALFGPRPLPVNEYKKLKSWQKKRQLKKPGIISPWILNGYHKQTFDNWMKSDIEYIKNKNLKKDIELLLRTFGLMSKMFIQEISNLFIS